MELSFVIPLSPVTKKNSQRIIRCGGHSRIVPSAQYTRYERDAGRFLRPPPQPIAGPAEVTCLFYMPTRRKVDLTNLLEAIDDILVKHGILADDNARIIVSHDGSRVLHDKGNPRTEVTIHLLCDEMGEETNQSEKLSKSVRRERRQNRRTSPPLPDQQGRGSAHAVTRA